MNELKSEDAMRALAWYEVVGKNIGSVTLPYDELKAIADLIREKDACIEQLEMGLDEFVKLWNDEKKFLENELSDKDPEIERFNTAMDAMVIEHNRLTQMWKNRMFTIEQQMIGDLEEIWYEGHGFIEYDDLKRWKEQYIKNGQM